MNKATQKLSADYAGALRKFVADAQEAGLQEAYELGRRAIADGLGVLEVAQVHQQTLTELLKPHVPSENARRRLAAAESFFQELLSPFEVMLRGFRETTDRLQQLNAELEKGNRRLAAANRKLESQIAVRKRAEKALRESRERLRGMFNEARRLQQDLRNLSNQVLHAQEEERKRISRELHDQVGQGLTAVSITLESAKKNGSGQPARERIEDAQRLLRETMEVVHDFARELRPTMLDELGLLPALRSALKTFSARTGIDVFFRGDAVAEELTGEQKTVLFRVAQESLTNVARHAKASRVEAAIRRAGTGICMEICDNGRSFKYDEKNFHRTTRRLGLLGMSERVRLVDGSFNVIAQPDKGTTIRVLLPLLKKAPAENATVG